MNPSCPTCGPVPSYPDESREGHLVTVFECDHATGAGYTPEDAAEAYRTASRRVEERAYVAPKPVKSVTPAVRKLQAQLAETLRKVAS